MSRGRQVAIWINIDVDVGGRGSKKSTKANAEIDGKKREIKGLTFWTSYPFYLVSLLRMDHGHMATWLVRRDFAVPRMRTSNCQHADEMYQIIRLTDRHSHVTRHSSATLPPGIKVFLLFDLFPFSAPRDSAVGFRSFAQIPRTFPQRQKPSDNMSRKTRSNQRLMTVVKILVEYKAAAGDNVNPDVSTARTHLNLTPPPRFPP